MGVLHTVRRTFRRAMLEHRMIKTGQIYHDHCWEIVVSKKELLIQLAECSIHDNLLKLLIYGKENKDYEQLLLLTSLKFEFLGSLVYPVNKAKTTKPPLKTYIRELFQGSYESPDEVKDSIRKITGSESSNEFARLVFRKLMFVIYTCVPCMADTDELWWMHTYRCFLEYAIEHDEFAYPTTKDVKTLWDAMPKDIPHLGCNRHYVLDHVPTELREKEIKHSDIPLIMRR